jgi:hypothetical protein
MPKQRIIPLIAFIAFAVWTTFLTHDYNYMSFFEPVLSSRPGIQVLTDLSIAMIMILVWIFYDAQKSQRRFWPYLIITIVFGSFGPLLYLILRKN